MEKSLAACLMELAALAEKNGDLAAVKKAIQELRDRIRLQGDETVAELDRELATWQDKLAVILKELPGRKGLANHARFWAGKIR